MYDPRQPQLHTLYTNELLLIVPDPSNSRNTKVFVGPKDGTLRLLPLEYKSSGWMDGSCTFEDGENQLAIDGSYRVSFNGQNLTSQLNLAWYQVTETADGYTVTKKPEMEQTMSSAWMGD